MGKALALAVGGILTAVLNVLLADKLKARICWFTQALLDLAVERLPQTQRERFAEEWASHLNDVSGDFAKIAFSRGCVSAAGEMASFLGHRNRGFGRVLKRSLEFLKQFSKRFVHLVSAAGALFLGEDSMLAKGRIVPTVVVFTLLSGLAGFLASYAFPTKYTSQSLILVEGQKVPESMVQPVVSEDLTARVATLQQQVLSESRLEPVVQRLYPGKNRPGRGRDYRQHPAEHDGRAVDDRSVADRQHQREQEARRTGCGARFLCELHVVQRARCAAGVQRADHSAGR